MKTREQIVAKLAELKEQARLTKPRWSADNPHAVSDALCSKIAILEWVLDDDEEDDS